MSLPEVIDSVLELQQRGLLSAGITLRKRYASDAMIYGFPVELRQVFLNLIGDAIRQCPAAEPCVCISPKLPIRESDAAAAISVTDTGTGIRREDADNLFRPFFTTKAAKGTGLGLWISKGIVQKYEGRITFRSLRRGDRKSHASAYSYRPKRQPGSQRPMARSMSLSRPRRKPSEPVRTSEFGCCARRVAPLPGRNCKT